MVGDVGVEGGGTVIEYLLLQFVLSRGLRFSPNFYSINDTSISRLTAPRITAVISDRRQ